MESSLKTLQVIRLAMLMSIVIYALMTKLLPSRTTPNPIIFYAITLMSIILVGAMFVARRMLVVASERVLATSPADAKALSLWRTGHLLTYCLSEAVALYGLVLHFLGFTLSQVAPFYIVSFVLILFFSPRRPSNEIG